MKKRSQLTLLEGSFETGFPAILQISSGEDRSEIETQVTGKLPPAEQLWLSWQLWRRTYRQAAMRRTRIKAKPGQMTDISDRQLGLQFSILFNQWLNGGNQQWLKIRDCLHRHLHPSDEIEFVIQTNDLGLQQLPWHLWDFFAHYPYAEIALSNCEYYPVKPATPKHRKKVEILALLGTPENLNLDEDRAYLEQLSPQAHIEFLVEPQVEELNDRLWEKNWQILFFAGHSWTDGQGHIWLNQNEVLTLEQLKYALKKAIDNGLCLAIFNSCDGLGLARELTDLQLGQIIVMREPVSDIVAQTFLKYFLTSFAEGKSLYMAVRSARERLQKLETKYPYATWLPVIFHNSVATAPTWRKLVNSPKRRRYWSSKTLFSLIAFPTAVVTTAFVLELKEPKISEFAKLSVKKAPKKNTEQDNTPNSIPEAEIESISIDEGISNPSNASDDSAKTIINNEGKIALTQIKDFNKNKQGKIIIDITDVSNKKTKTYVFYEEKSDFERKLKLDNLDEKNVFLIEEFEGDNLSKIAIEGVNNRDRQEINDNITASSDVSHDNLRIYLIYDREDNINLKIDSNDYNSQNSLFKIRRNQQDDNFEILIEQNQVFVDLSNFNLDRSFQDELEIWEEIIEPTNNSIIIPTHLTLNDLDNISPNIPPFSFETRLNIEDNEPVIQETDLLEVRGIGNDEFFGNSGEDALIVGESKDLSISQIDDAFNNWHSEVDIVRDFTLDENAIVVLSENLSFADLTLFENSILAETQILATPDILTSSSSRSDFLFVRE